jgi:hypothetical protein
MVPIVNRRYDSLSSVVVHACIGTLELGSSTLTSSVECPINSTMGVQGSDPILDHLHGHASQIIVTQQQLSTHLASTSMTLPIYIHDVLCNQPLIRRCFGPASSGDDIDNEYRRIG